MGKNKDAIIVGSLGSISQDLAEIKHPRKILIKGAMGCAIGCGLGLALGQKRRVVVVIGDGAFLMKAGSMATVLAHKPDNLQIFIINNGKYASTGGQKNNFEFFPPVNSLFFKQYETDEDIRKQAKPQEPRGTLPSDRRWSPNRRSKNLGKKA